MANMHPLYIEDMFPNMAMNQLGVGGVAMQLRAHGTQHFCLHSAFCKGAITIPPKTLPRP